MEELAYQDPGHLPMNCNRPTLLFLRAAPLLIGVMVLGQNAPTIPQTDFLVDSSKPFAYLEVDHVGPRDPLESGEPKTGIWIRFQNNCRVPIVVEAIRGNKVSTLALADEVIPEPLSGIHSGGGAGTSGFPIVKGYFDILNYPNADEDAVQSAEWNQEHKIQGGSMKGAAHRPMGYRMGGLTSIPPGGTLLFSLPADHVTPEWYSEIPFRLALPHDETVRPPNIYLALHWEDLPEEYRMKRSDGPNRKRAGGHGPGGTR